MFQRVSTFLIGILSGAIVGTTLMLFLTPDSGQNLRQRSRQQFQNRLSESILAAEARRQQLREQLASMTTLPDKD